MIKRSGVSVHLFLAVFAAAAYASPNAGSDYESDWKEQIVAAAFEELERNAVPSLQIAIGYKGRIIFDDAFGLANVENYVSASNKTKYRTASISKWLTATATMRLAERGSLDLDEPIQTYCPQFPEKQWSISTRDLLTHTSGIRHYADYESELARATTKAELAAIERRRYQDILGRYTRFTDSVGPLESFKNERLKFRPGTNWLYSSFGYRVLGCVLEGAAKSPYRTVMQNEIFDKAGMHSTTVDDAWVITQHRAAGYRVTQGEPLRRADMRDVSENLPAGGHLSTARDIVAFALAFQSGQLVSGSSSTLMSSPIHAELDKSASRPPWRDAQPSEQKYGYGVMLFPVGEGVWWGHTGQQAGASSIVMQSPDNGLSIAVLTNAKGWRGYISFTETLRVILEKEFNGKIQPQSAKFSDDHLQADIF